MRKNGFIATSILYSFFIVFALLALLVLATYSHYRILNDELNSSIKKELNVIGSNNKLIIIVPNGTTSKNELIIKKGESGNVTITPELDYYIKSATCSEGYSISNINTSINTLSTAQEITINSNTNMDGTCVFNLIKPEI